MSVDRALLASYLRQRRELGETELFLDTMTRQAALAWVRPAAVPPSKILTAKDAKDAKVRRGDQGSPSTPETGATQRSDFYSKGKTAAVVRESSPRRPSNPLRPLRLNEEGGTALKVLADEAAGCTRCALHEGRQNVVFGEGSATAELVVVGEAPGGQEDRTGRPFVGPAGKLLDLLLLSIGFPRDEVYICNVLKCRPPNNRDPKPIEVETCTSYLHGQLEGIAPRVLLAVGKFAAQTLAGSDASIGRLRGRVHAYRGIPVVATYHPAYLLRSPRWTQATWQDFQLARQVLDEQA